MVANDKKLATEEREEGQIRKKLRLQKVWKGRYIYIYTHITGTGEAQDFDVVGLACVFQTHRKDTYI